MTLRLTRRRFWQLAIGVATVVVVGLLVMIGLGVLVLPSTAPEKITISEVHWTIIQGTTSTGFGWFGPSERIANNSSGLPLRVTLGHSFTVLLPLTDLDSVNHTIQTVTVVSPFNVMGTSPSVPALVISGMDDFLISVTLGTSGASGDQSYTVQITLGTV